MIFFSTKIRGADFSEKHADKLTIMLCVRMIFYSYFYFLMRESRDYSFIGFCFELNCYSWEKRFANKCYLKIWEEDQIKYFYWNSAASSIESTENDVIENDETTGSLQNQLQHFLSIQFVIWKTLACHFGKKLLSQTPRKMEVLERRERIKRQT